MRLTLDSFLIRSDGRALDPDVVLLDGGGRVVRHLIVRLVAILHTEIVVLENGDVTRGVSWRVFYCESDHISHVREKMEHVGQ